jgi:outer membrane murein-binding lipoprotein Lpp
MENPTCASVTISITAPVDQMSPLSPARMPSSMILAFRLGRYNVASACTSCRATLAELDSLDVDATLAPLRAIPELDELRERVERDFAAPRRAATAAKDQAARVREEARSLQRDMPQMIAEARTQLETRRAETVQWEQQLTSALSPSEANLVRRRIEVRRHGADVLEAKIEFLVQREQQLDPLVRLYDIHLDTASARLEILDRLNEAAQAELQERIAVESRSLAAELTSKQEELESTQSPYRRLFLTAEIDALQAKAHLSSLRLNLQEAQKSAGQIGRDLSEATRTLGARQTSATAGSVSRRQDEVLTEIMKLEAQVDRSRQRREARSLRDALREARTDFEAVLTTRGEFEEKFEAKLSAAEQAAAVSTSRPASSRSSPG